jgi:hypothetical protein
MGSEPTLLPGARVPRLRRSASFLGLHFDFHAREEEERVGANINRDVVGAVLERVRPDYVQCDCKGHAGISSYPTKVGFAAPGLLGDILRVWRTVTAEHGVALYVHYSGIYDVKAVEVHPDWARLDEQGRIDPRNASVYGPYVDELMIPQLKELIDEYDVDGVWVDGDCWALTRDYSQLALEAYRSAGFGDAPPRLAVETAPLWSVRRADMPMIEQGTRLDPSFRQFSEVQREGFRQYLRRYVDELHEHCPTFQIASNWAFSSLMPEAVTADVDYLSGDSATVFGSDLRLDPRFFVRQGKPWDIMTWTFVGHGPQSANPAASTKSVAQLCQEAAVIISLGGGYQSYANQRTIGEGSGRLLELMTAVADFCRQRQRYCHGTDLIPQVALLHSSSAFYDRAPRLFDSLGQLNALLGTLNCLLDAQQVVEILLEHQVADLIDRYPLVLVPEWEDMPSWLVERLIAYIENGGRLLITGARSLVPFEDSLGIARVGEPHGGSVFWLESRGRTFGHRGDRTDYRITGDGRAYGRLFPKQYDVGTWLPAAIITRLGEGTIAGVPFDFGRRYLDASTSSARDFVKDLCRELFPSPTIEVEGTGLVDVVLATKGDALIVHLINMAGQQRNPLVDVFDEVPPLGPFKVRVRCGAEPQAVTLEPGGLSPQCAFADGVLAVDVPKLEIHSMVVIVP